MKQLSLFITRAFFFTIIPFPTIVTLGFTPFTMLFRFSFYIAAMSGISVGLAIIFKMLVTDYIDNQEFYKLPLLPIAITLIAMVQLYAAFPTL